MQGRKKITIFISLSFTGLLWGCSSPSSDFMRNSRTVVECEQQDETIQEALIYEGSMELQYAKNFSVDYYQGGYKKLMIADGTQILTVPENTAIPKDLEEGTIVLKQPVNRIYMVASSAMDMFQSLDAIDTISFSGQKEEGWYIEGAKEAMEKGEMVYAGKYNKPDYELLVSNHCSLVVENMMISHAPEVVEKLADFEIPVMIDKSSYESHPLGRVEWVKFYGAIVDKEEVANELFEKQASILEEMNQCDKTNQTVAFFFITSNGLVQVRQSDDYIPKMIELAGGKYVFEDSKGDNTRRSTINMQVEEFYAGAKDADFLVYNSSIDGGIHSIDELLNKCPMLEDFKAVQEENVWCTTNDMYQQSMSIGYMIQDFHNMLSGHDKENMTYLYKIR